MIDIKAKPFYLDDEGVKWVEETKKNMTLEEKIGQLFVPVGYSADPGYLQHEMLDHHVGGILYRSGNGKETQAGHRWLQERSKIPMFIAANLETGGDGIATDGTSFARQMEVAATNDPTQAYRLGKIACSEGKAVGCNWALAPVVDIDRNWRNPITNVRTYGNDPEFILKCALQYKKAADEEGLAVAVKHFPGDGCDEVDQHILISVNNLTCEEWDETYGKIYRGMIDDGALTVMAGHIAQPAYQKHFNTNFPDKLVPATLSPELLQGLLRGKLGFNGLISTDSTCMLGFTVAMRREIAVPYSIEAGCDIFLFNKDVHEDYQFMMEGHKKGILSEKRLDEAVTRILAAKASLGLHKKAKEQIVPSENALKILKNETHEAWARECAAKSVTIVKNNENLLPISPNKTKRVLLEILGNYPSSQRITARWKSLLEREGFDVTVYEKEDFSSVPDFSVKNFTSRYDLVLYIGNMENMSNQVTNRYQWYTFWGNGDNCPWFTAEVPVIYISLANPYALVDVPQIQTYINCYSNNDYVIDACMEKLMGRSEFKGISPIDPFCGKEYLRY